MDILIKSFFRPYLLDRCIYSIQKNVIGNYQITILDDGTPENYLDKIKQKYPFVNIQKSPFYEEKVAKLQKYIVEGEKYFDNRIPMGFWYENVKNARSEYLILTEDDVWFTRPLDIDKKQFEMQEHQIDLLKLGYGGDHFRNDENHRLTDEISYHNPKLILPSSKLYGTLLNNSFKLTDFLEKNKLINPKWKRQLWLMINIPMPMHRKEYLLFLLQDRYNRVNENLQLKNAVRWHIKYKNKKNKFCFLNQQSMKTTLFSSASFNSHNDFDLIKFNYKLSEAWLNDEFDAYHNFPEDFTENYIKTVCEAIDIDFRDWQKWNGNFKNAFKNFE